MRSASKSYQYQYAAGTESVTTSRIQLIYGLPKQLSDTGLLPDDYLAGIKGPYLGLVQSAHSGNWQLVLSGRNEQELLEATAYFANLTTHSLATNTPSLTATSNQKKPSSKAKENTRSPNLLLNKLSAKSLWFCL